MSDIYTRMDLPTLKINLALKQQQLAQAEAEGKPHAECIPLYRELKAILYYLSIKEVSSEKETAL
jgi:hypothetical protein